ncbi:uncharacterized protein LOC129727139 isoform X5 [Wyeomyia smithii]|uniref:uncharacterized protein LOC129727139 isoform X5 n=1 Tax=Wyeomyia smithii TaxID=174621 RepID=UPI0024680A11|nr:uncharacterized protein LOC129727139 isoform X5 [Wyeomyia smithii]
MAKCLGLVPLYAIIIWMAYFCIQTDLKLPSGSVVMSQSGAISIFMYYLQPICGTVGNRIHNEAIGHIFQRIQAADDKLNSLGLQNTYFDQWKIAIGLVISSIISSLILFVSLEGIFEIQYLFGTMFFLLHYVLMCSYATILALQLLRRFQSLAKLFRMYFPTNPTCSGFPSVHTETTVCSEKEQLTVIKQIKILHDKLNDVVELVNYCFSVQITFCVGLCFVIGVVCSFGLFRAFIYRNELFYMGVLNFIWYMYYLFFVLFFIAVGSKITREGKRIGVLVHKAINCSTSSAVINELNIFSQQLLHRSPVITCGLFVYDWTLLYTMIGATATYLIILIQFDVSFPNLVNVNNGTTSTGSAGT